MQLLVSGVRSMRCKGNISIGQHKALLSRSVGTTIPWDPLPRRVTCRDREKEFGDPNSIRTSPEPNLPERESRQGCSITERERSSPMSLER
jgi:hypothetical protein